MSDRAALAAGYYGVDNDSLVSRRAEWNVYAEPQDDPYEANTVVQETIEPIPSVATPEPETTSDDDDELEIGSPDHVPVRLDPISGAVIDDQHSAPVSAPLTARARASFSCFEIETQFRPAARFHFKKQLYEMSRPTVADDGPLCDMASYYRPSFIQTMRVDRHAVSTVLSVQDVFSYEPTSSAPLSYEAFPNYADANPFAYGGGHLFAQDEHQQAEIPCLSSVRSFFTTNQNRNDGTIVRISPEFDNVDALWPFLQQRWFTMVFSNIRRRLAIDTTNIYGNAFAAQTSFEAIREHVRILQPAQIVNVYTVVAPERGADKSLYNSGQLISMWMAIHVAFGAVVSEARRLIPGCTVTVHGGNWGCGAFGNNPVVSHAMQILAARATGVDHLILHTVDAKSQAASDEARALVEEIYASVKNLCISDVIMFILEKKYRWGFKNGT